jgi:hypothetical protein
MSPFRRAPRRRPLALRPRGNAKETGCLDSTGHTPCPQPRRTTRFSPALFVGFLIPISIEIGCPNEPSFSTALGPVEASTRLKHIRRGVALGTDPSPRQ